MTLYIDTTNPKKIILVLKKNQKELFRHEEAVVNKRQAEKLLIVMDKFLKDNGLTWGRITDLEVNNVGGSFTGLRLGVLTANTLAFILNLPVKGLDDQSLNRQNIKIVKPLYDREPDIGPSKIDI